MENEFEIENFDDFTDGLVDFDDFDDDQGFESETRTAILSKNNMIALICLRTAEKQSKIFRIDPREMMPSVQIYEDADKAIEWYDQSLVTSRQNGWTIAYDGLPLRG